MWGSGSVRSSYQTVQITPYVYDFRTVNNPGSWQTVGASKTHSFTFHFWPKSFVTDDVKLAELSDNSSEWKNVTLTLPTYFQGESQTPNPQACNVYINGGCRRVCSSISGSCHANLSPRPLFNCRAVGIVPYNVQIFADRGDGSKWLRSDTDRRSTSKCQRIIKLGHSWRLLGPVELGLIGRCEHYYNSTQRTHLASCSWVEMSRVVRMFMASDPFDVQMSTIICTQYRSGNRLFVRSFAGWLAVAPNNSCRFVTEYTDDAPMTPRKTVLQIDWRRPHGVRSLWQKSISFLCQS